MRVAVDSISRVMRGPARSMARTDLSTGRLGDGKTWPWKRRAGGGGGGLPPEDALEELGHLVVLLLAVHVRLALHPGNLHHPALAGERQVAVPGIVGAQEGEHGAHGGRHLEPEGLVVLLVVEQQQAAALVLLPLVVHVD